MSTPISYFTCNLNFLKQFLPRNRHLLQDILEGTYNFLIQEIDMIFPITWLGSWTWDSDVSRTTAPNGGASVSIISEQTWKKTWAEQATQLKPTIVKLKIYIGSTVEVKGY
jgi:hypothetical protein